MATLDIDDAVVTDLRALSDIAPCGVYYDDEAPLEDQLPTQDGQVVPYVVLHSGVGVSSDQGRGICGVEKDPIENYFIVEVVGPNRAISKLLGDAITQHLLGRKYEGATSLSLGPRSLYRETVAERSVPNTYHYAALFRYITNL